LTTLLPLLALNDVTFGSAAVFPFPGAHAFARHPRPCRYNSLCYLVPTGD
jgi:hypothetical protein